MEIKKILYFWVIQKCKDNLKMKKIIDRVKNQKGEFTIKNLGGRLPIYRGI